MEIGGGHTIDELAEAVAKKLRVEIQTGFLGEDYILTEEEAARMLGVSRRTMLRMRKAGEVHCGQIAGKPRYSLGQIRRLMRETVSQD